MEPSPNYIVVTLVGLFVALPCPLFPDADDASTTANRFDIFSSHAALDPSRNPVSN